MCKLGQKEACLEIVTHDKFRLQDSLEQPTNVCTAATACKLVHLGEPVKSLENRQPTRCKRMCGNGKVIKSMAAAGTLTTTGEGMNISHASLFTTD